MGEGLLSHTKAFNRKRERWRDGDKETDTGRALRTYI